MTDSEPATEGGSAAKTSVFFSYSRADQTRALPIIGLIQAAGFTVWWDGLIEGGDRFSKTTEAALERAQAVVVLWSKSSVDSHWVHDEATRGRDRRVLVPLSLDGTAPPLGFGQFQAIDLSRSKIVAKDTEIQRMIQAIAALHGDNSTPVIPRSVPETPRFSRRAAIAAGSTAVVVASGLAAWRFGWLGGGTPDESVAVLPFRNLSGDPAQSYFSDGLSEEIRLALSRNEDLRVLAPVSAEKAMEQHGDVPGIAGALGAAFLLRGSVRRSGDSLRIAAELLDGRTGDAAWSDQFNRTMTDIFALQSEIADSVEKVVSAQMAGSEGKITGRGELGGTRSLRAYDAYLRGNAYYALRSGEAAYRAALKQYDDAVSIDPKYAKAHAARARVIIVITNSYAQASEFKERYDDAVASAQRAVAIAPKLAIAQSTLGFVLVQGRLDLRGAKKPYEIANQLGRGDSTVQMLYAAYSAQMGVRDKALIAINRAVELDPLNPSAHRIKAFVHYCARRFDEVIAACKKALELNSKLGEIYGYLGDALLQTGELDEARAAYAKEPDDLPRFTGLAIVNHKLGDKAAAESALASLVAKLGDASTYQQAQIFAQWGNKEEAMQKLLLARKIGDVGLALAGTDPLLDPLLGTPEFSSLLKQLGFG